MNPNSFLLLGLIVMVFGAPVLPVGLHDLAYNFLFSCVFLLAALSLQHVKRRLIIGAALILIAVNWFADKIDLSVLTIVSRIGQGLFFVFIVIRLIQQTAGAKNVNVRVIADSINGYLLVGIIYSLIVYLLFRFLPDAMFRT